MENKILFVDDAHYLLRLYKAFALGHGYVPYCASGGDEALKIMARENIRVFCLDLSMPGMDGFELCRRIKQINPFTRVYAVSGYSAGANPDKLQSAGFDGFMEKPVRYDTVFNACHAAFEQIASWEKRNCCTGDGAAQSGASVETVPSTDIQQMIEFEAYLLAEKNNFQGEPTGYWTLGEAHVKARLGLSCDPVWQAETQFNTQAIQPSFLG